MFAKDLTSSDETKKHLALLCIGELGQLANLGEIVTVANEEVSLKDLILSCFEGGAEETKAAAVSTLVVFKYPGCIEVPWLYFMYPGCINSLIV